MDGEPGPVMGPSTVGTGTREAARVGTEPAAAADAAGTATVARTATAATDRHDALLSRTTHPPLEAPTADDRQLAIPCGTAPSVARPTTKTPAPPRTRPRRCRWHSC